LPAGAFSGRNTSVRQKDHKNFDLAEEVPGKSTAALGDVARKTGAVIIASVFEKRSAGVYHNSAAIIDADGGLLGKYRKMHVPDDPLYHEKFYFRARRPRISGVADDARQNWRLRLLGPVVPGAARLTALRGAEIIFYPTAIGWHPSEKKEFGLAQHSAWETIQRSHAIANGCYVAAANRVGHEAPAGGDGIEFWGKALYAALMAKSLQKVPLIRRDRDGRCRMGSSKRASDALAISA